jgi:hypothetical protein
MGRWRSNGKGRRKDSGKKNVDDRPCFSVMSNTRCHHAHLLWARCRSYSSLVENAARVGANNNNLSAATGNNNRRAGKSLYGFYWISAIRPITHWDYQQASIRCAFNPIRIPYHRHAHLRSHLIYMYVVCPKLLKTIAKTQIDYYTQN